MAKLYKGVAYCSDCGNPDCPKVSAKPTWVRCPAVHRLGAEAGKECPHDVAYQTFS
jgi:hypothetical protein